MYISDLVILGTGGVFYRGAAILEKSSTQPQLSRCVEYNKPMSIVKETHNLKNII